MKITALFVSCLLQFGFLSAQQPRTLTVQEAIDLSLSHSGQLKYNQAKIEEATADLKEAVERKLPDANVTGGHIRLNSPNIDLKTSSNNNNGGTGSESPGKVSSATYGLLNASLPLYSGLKIRYGIESARYLAEASKLDADYNREEIILNAINAFDNLYKSKAAVNVVKESLEGNRARVKDFTNLEKNGLLARNDLLKAELLASNTELSLLDAENNWKLASINMDLMLGLPDSTILEPTIPDTKASEPIKGIEEFIQLAQQNRKDVAALDLRRKAAGAGVKVANGGYYPSIALTGGYIAAYVPHLLTVTNAVNIGVGVQYSISSLWKNQAKVDQAKARQKEIEANEGQLSDAVRMEVHQAYLAYTLSRKKIETYTKAVAQAEENYKITKNKYDNALANTTDLLDADIAQLQSRLNFAFAESDASAAYSKLLQTAGLLRSETENKNLK